MLQRLRPIVVLASFAVSCGGSSGTPSDAGLEGGVDGRTSHKKDSGMPDGAPNDDSRSDGGTPTDANPGDSPTPDVRTDVATGDGPAMDAGSGCHMIQGEASTLGCTSPSGPTATTVCKETGYEPGPCPSAGLTGCCTFKSGNTVCFYSSDSVPVSTDESTCKTAGGTWSTTAP